MRVSEGFHQVVCTIFVFSYEDDGTAKKFFVSSGSVTINDDSSVQVMDPSLLTTTALSR